jgi:hypothetical protein
MFTSLNSLINSILSLAAAAGLAAGTDLPRGAVIEALAAAADSTPTGDSLRLAVLAALNIADELFRSRADDRALDAERKRNKRAAKDRRERVDPGYTAALALDVISARRYDAAMIGEFRDKQTERVFRRELFPERPVLTGSQVRDSGHCNPLPHSV